MAERVGYINPECDVDTVHDFFAEETADLILDRHAYDVVIDAIDSVSEKARLIAGCHRRGIPIVVSGGLGGRSDPTMFREVDMARAEGDGLLRRVRSELRKKYGFPAGNVRPPHRKWGVPCVSSLEPTRFVPPSEEGEGELPARRTCDSGYGTFCPAAGALGFALAATAMRIVRAES